MKRIGLFLVLCLFLLTACAAPVVPGGVPVCPDLPDSVEAESVGAKTSETEPSETETFGTETLETESPTPDDAYALVDWMIFVCYNGRTYTRDFSEPTVIPEDQLGALLGCVETKPPSPTPMDYLTNVPDLTSFGYPIGAEFYEINGVSRDYEIAVYDRDSGAYHLLCYEESLPNNTTVNYSGNAESSGGDVEVFTEYEAYFGRWRENYAAVDEAFFEDNVLAEINIQEGSGSITHHVQAVRRVGDHIEVFVRRLLPLVRTDDVMFCTITVAISREDWDGSEVKVQYLTEEYSITMYDGILSAETRSTREWWDEGVFKSDTAEVITDYDSFFGRDLPIFSVYDEAFFRDNVLAVVYLEEGSGSITHEVTKVQRVDDRIEIHIRRNVPAEGTCDMAYWTFTTAISREDWNGAEIVPIINTVQAWNE